MLNPDYLTRNLTDLFNQFLRFMKDGGIEEYEDSADYAPSGCVSFMTVHQAKGLEFPIVIVGSLGAVPRKNHTRLDEVLECNYHPRPPFEPLEEIKYYDYRRLYYTAFSRAQNLLVLTCKEQAGKTPSRYFEDILYYLPQWRDPLFQPELMLFEAVKKVSIKKEYSFTSHITVYENCPQQYRFFKELAFTPVRVTPMMFGTLVHQTIEDIHQTVLRGDVQEITTARITEWFESNYTQLSKKEQTFLAHATRKAAMIHVLRYFWRERQQWGELQNAEVGLSLLRSDYILKGSIDLVRSDGDRVEIIDFKTEKKPDQRDRKRLDRYQRQLEVYAHLVEERTGKRVSRMHLYFTGEADNPYITFKKSKKAISKTVAAFDEIVTRIEHKDFRQENRPSKLCPDCDLRFFCGTGSRSHDGDC